MAYVSFDKAMAQISEQHRWMIEQHTRWIDMVTDTAVQALREENGRLENELSALKNFIKSSRRSPKEPPLPKIPVVLHEVPKLPAGLQMLTGVETVKPPSGNGVLMLKPPGATKNSPDSTTSTSEGDMRRVVSKSSGPEFELPGMVSEAAWTSGPAPAPAPGEARLARRAKTQTEGVGFSTATFNTKRGSKDRRRLRGLFGLPPDALEVQLDVASKVLSSRLEGRRGCGSWVIGMLVLVDAAREEMAETRPEFQAKWISDDGFSLVGLMYLVGPDAGEVIEHVPPQKRQEVWELAHALQMMTLDEVVEDSAKATSQEPKEKTFVEKGDFFVNAVVGTMTLINIFGMGVSIDYSPEHVGWLLFEVVCVAAFIGEMAWKLWARGLRDYCCGEAYVWNIIDSVVTFMSVCELGLSMYIVVMAAEDDGQLAKLSNFARPVVMLRVIRVVRVVRLVKLLSHPGIRDLANMLVGFVIGLPAMVWVLVVFCFVLYLLALIFRLVLGPNPGQDYIHGGPHPGGCGWADDWVDYDHPVCKLHYLYGEEFFDTVGRSMFTVFRFMLGDYSTRGGKSMIVAFSYGYGLRFDLVFTIFMIIVIFGLFNIITAIFVDSTTAGLKHNDVKRKYAQQYETKYVKSKLRALVDRVQEILAEQGVVDADEAAPNDLEAMSLEREHFCVVVEDPQVQELLGDLDVDIANPAGMYDTFDGNSDGIVTMLEFISVIMKLRGDPAKTDVIECVVSIRNLQDRFDQFASVMLQHVQADQAADGMNDDAGGATPPGRGKSRSRRGSWAHAV